MVNGASSALFGNYPDSDLLYNKATVIEYNDTANFIYAISELNGDFITKSSSIENVGVALVCDSGNCTTPSLVPVPATVWLFGSGLIGLIGLVKRKARV